MVPHAEQDFFLCYNRLDIFCLNVGPLFKHRVAEERNWIIPQYKSSCPHDDFWKPLWRVYIWNSNIFTILTIIGILFQYFFFWPPCYKSLNPVLCDHLFRFRISSYKFMPVFTYSNFSAQINYETKFTAWISTHWKDVALVVFKDHLWIGIYFCIYTVTVGASITCRPTINQEYAFYFSVNCP